LADLDFGIYRIMNYKRDVIEKFIIQDLPKAIADELDRDALADQAQAAKELKEVSDLSGVFDGRLLGTISVRTNPSGRPTQSGYAVAHEYVLYVGGGPRSAIGRMPPTETQKARFSEQDEKGAFEWRNLRREGSNSDRAARRYLVYRGQIDHRQIVVIWRETEGWQKADLEQDKKFVAEKELTEGVDEIFVNGDSFIPNARALEPVFKARMFAEVQV
jgi:hypothetical protein